MKLFEFRKKAAPPEESVEPPPAEIEKVTPEELVEGNWKFSPAYMEKDGTRIYGHETIDHATAIYQAQSLARIADELEEIRERLTKPKAPLDLRVFPEHRRDDKEPA